MKIKVKIMLENYTKEKAELATYLIDTIAQNEVGKYVELTSNVVSADMFIDLKELTTKEQIAVSMPTVIKSIAEIALTKIPVLVKGQKKIRKKLHN